MKTTLITAAALLSLYLTPLSMTTGLLIAMSIYNIYNRLTRSTQ